MDECKTSEGGERVVNLAEPMEGVGTTSEDVMVEVLGSDVFVDGVRSHEDDDEIDAVASEDDGSGDNNKTTDDMDIDSKLPIDSSQPLGGETKDTDLVKNVGSSETEEVNTGEKEIPDEEVAESSFIVVEETQLIDDDDDGFVEETRVVVEKNFVEETRVEDDDGFVEETRVVVEKKFVEETRVEDDDGFVEETRVVVEKNLIEETNELENPLEGDDVSQRGKTDALGETVVDASGGGPVESSRPTGGSSNSVQEQDGSESAAADTIVATVEQDTLLTTKFVPNQEEEEEEEEEEKNPNVENGVECHPSLVLETSTQLGEDNLNSRRDSVDVSPFPGESTAAMQSGGIHADVPVLEEANTEEPSLELIVPFSVEGEVKKIKEDTEGSSEGAVEETQTEDKSRVEGAAGEADDGGVLTADSEQPTQIVIAGKIEEVDEETISSTCSIDQDSKPEEGNRDNKMDDSAENVEAASLTGQTTEANMEVVTGPSEKVEQEQEAIEQEEEEPLEEDITHAESHLALSEHILCESTEMNVQVTEHGECVLTVNEIVLGSNNDIQVVVVDNNTEYMNGSLTVNLPIDVDKEQQPATDTDEKQVAPESDMADIDETHLDTIPTEEEEVHGEEHVTADYDEQNDQKTETTFPSYNLPQEKENDFAVSDLVWGKVRSHPWWPGQIFDPSAASEAALKYHKKEDSYLVAYYGDRTFAWMNETSGLKPLRNHFSQLEKQSNLEAFRNAVDCALEEVSRRARLSLRCSCISQDEINFQIVENDGIKEELCKREGLGDANTATTFEPDKLFEYVKELAQLPFGGADIYELTVAKAQLLSFYRLKGGFSQLPEFQDGGELVEGDTGNLNFDELSADDDDEEECSSGGGQEEENKPPQKRSLKRKHNLRDITYPIKKGRSMKELMSETTSNNDDDQTSTKVVMNATTAAPPVPKPSFKIGECISRVASQLTGSSSSLLKQQHADPEDASERSMNDTKPSLHDLLSRLQVAAQEPLKEHTNDNGNSSTSSFDVIRSFFSDFRNSAVLEQNPELGKMGGGGGGTKRKRPYHLDDGSTEAFEFEDMNDSYWTDRVIENGVEEELLPSDGSGAIAVTTAKRLENHIVPVELKPLKTGRRPYNKRRHLETGTPTNHGNNNGLGFTIAEKPGYIDPNAPAELVIIFSEFGFFPATEVSLNRMFKRFGPLRESQTELDRDTCRARVVFKKCSDAEVACSSAGRFNIFGPVHVIYQLNYNVSPEFKTSAMIEDGGGHHEEDYIE